MIEQNFPVVTVYCAAQGGSGFCICDEIPKTITIQWKLSNYITFWLSCFWTEISVIWDHSIKSYSLSAVLSCGTVILCSSCRFLSFKWMLLSNTFLWCCFYFLYKVVDNVCLCMSGHSNETVIDRYLLTFFWCYLSRYLENRNKLFLTINFCQPPSELKGVRGQIPLMLSLDELVSLVNDYDMLKNTFDLWKTITLSSLEGTLFRQNIETSHT